MTFEWTRDFGLIKAVLTHPSQVRMASDDGTDLASWSPCEDERVCYITAREGDAVRGIFTLIGQNAVCYEIHAAILPQSWGPGSREALRGAIEFFRSQTCNLNMGAGIPRIVCGIPAYNKLAIRLAKDCGFRAYGRNPASWLRHATLHDLVLLGISRP